MPDISWSMTVQVPGGPILSLSKTFRADAYDEVGADVLADNQPKTLEVQPSDSGQVKFLVISSTLYSEDITYSVGSSTTSIKLDAPQVFLGEGAVSLLGIAPQKISFTNNFGQNVRISILVGRDPIVPPSP